MILHEKKSLDNIPERNIVWEAHPNIERNRLLGLGQGRKLDDYNIIEELTTILQKWLY